MSDVLFQKKAQCKLLETVGTLSSGEGTIEGIQVVIEFPLAQPGTIIGRVIGKEKDAYSIWGLSDMGPYMSYRARSRFDLGRGAYSYEIRSDKVLTKGSVLRSEPEGFTYQIATLEFEELELVETHDLSFVVDSNIGSDLPERFLVFHLSAPRSLFGASWKIRSSYSGTCQVEIHEACLDFSDIAGFPAMIRPWFFKDQSEDYYKEHVQAISLGLYIPFNDALNESDVVQFQMWGRELADDLCCLGAFLARAQVVWFGYQLRQGSTITSFRKTVEKSSRPEYSDIHGLVSYEDLMNFYSKAVPALRKLRNAEINLSSSINLYCEAVSKAHTVTQRFILLFLSLEQVRDQLAEEYSLVSILESTAFETLSNQLKELIRSSVEDHQKASLIIGKLKELNRSSLRTSLLELFFKLGIDTYDIKGGEHSDALSFVSLRNSVFHQGLQLTSDEHFKETTRLQYCLERLLLRLLDWDKFDRSPDEAGKKWLAS